LGVAVVSKEPHIFSLFHTLKYVFYETYFKVHKQGHKPYFNNCCMNVRKWRYAPEPPALKGVLPQIYAIRHIGRETIDSAYTSFSLHKVHISWPHRPLLHVPRGLYTNLFSLHLFWVFLTAFYEHILSHFVISYSLLVISLFNNYLSMCIPIL
jgi:hypothetical protein